MTETFHFSISMISRGKSKSAVASAAYISCEKIKNEWDGEVHDYHNKKELLHSEIFLPENVPIALKDRTTLWNSVELNEKASNAQLARNFIIALPKELSFEENKRLITDFIQESFVSKGMIADLAIHDESNEENNNIHAHIMTTLLNKISSLPKGKEFVLRELIAKPPALIGRWFYENVNKGLVKNVEHIGKAEGGVEKYKRI